MAVLQAEAGSVVRRVRNVVAGHVLRRPSAAVAERGVGVAEGAEDVDAGRGPGGDIELDALARRAADVGDVDLAGDVQVRDVELQVVPVDEEDGAVERHATVGQEGLEARFYVPRVLFTVGLAAGW